MQDTFSMESYSNPNALFYINGKMNLQSQMETPKRQTSQSNLEQQKHCLGI